MAVLFVELAALLVMARSLGALARRAGQPEVLGQLLAGLVLGPSVFGKVWPGGFNWFLPAHHPMENGLLLTVAQLSLVILLVVIGAETDLKVIRHLGRAATSVSAFSLIVPFGAGLLLAFLLPSDLLGPHGGRSGFALLIAGAVAVSSLPVIARIVGDMGLARRNFGQLILAAGTVQDTFGFLVVAVAAALVGTGSTSGPGHLFQVIAALVILAVVVLTLGQRLVDRALRGVLAGGTNLGRGLNVTIMGALIVTALFQVLGIEGALGAFVFGIVLGRSRFASGEHIRVVGALSSAVFAPIYFATAGLRVDVANLDQASILISFVVLVVVAATTKFVGAALGAWIGRLPRREWVALGIGLNGRGALQVIIGSAGLSIGAFTSAAYSEVILMSIITSLATPPLLRLAARGWRGTVQEQQRLGHEGEMKRNIVIRGQRILIPSRGSPNSIVAAEVLGAAWPEESEVTVLSIQDPPDSVAAGVEPVAQVLEPRTVERRHIASQNVLDGILAEAKLGYGVIGLGAAEAPTPNHLLSPVIDDLLIRSPIPMVIVRRAHDLEGPLPPAFAKALVPVTGSAPSRAAQEVAFGISRNLGTEVVLAHVVTRPEAKSTKPGEAPSSGSPDRTQPGSPDRTQPGPLDRPRSAAGAGQGVLAGARAHAEDMAVRVSSLTRHGLSAGDEIVTVAEDMKADLIVMGANVRMVDEHPFLGHTVEHILEHADATVVVVVLPDPAGSTDPDRGSEPAASRT